MLKRYYLVYFLLIYSNTAYSSVWDDIVACFSDLCNCGQGQIDETWNDKIVRAIKPDAFCPPRNRREGHDFDNCLNQFDPPKADTMFYIQHCAEKTSDSTYFAPKIHIRMQACTFLAYCWSKTATLKRDGKCKIWPTGTVLPILRICTQVAVPEVPAGGLNEIGVPSRSRLHS